MSKTPYCLECKDLSGFALVITLNLGLYPYGVLYTQIDFVNFVNFENVDWIEIKTLM